jgi:RNA polymerase sigma factor (TIGR02999 family)
MLSQDYGSATADALVPALYNELRQIARRHLLKHPGAATLQPTALVHEAYVKLSRSGEIGARGRSHFLAIAARAMRQVLVDQAKRRRAAKRECRRAALDPEELSEGLPVLSNDLPALDRALSELARIDGRQSRIVALRFFAGASVAETADVLGLSTRTVEREWRMARAWLRLQMSRDRLGERS